MLREKQHRGGEGGKGKTKKKKNKRVAESLRVAVAGSSRCFSLLLCVLGLFKMRGLSTGLCSAAPRMQREGGFGASLVPYFAFKIFKAPQKAPRGSFKVWKASAIMLFIFIFFKAYTAGLLLTHWEVHKPHNFILFNEPGKARWP